MIWSVVSSLCQTCDQIIRQSFYNGWLFCNIWGEQTIIVRVGWTVSMSCWWWSEYQVGCTAPSHMISSSSAAAASHWSMTTDCSHSINSNSSNIYHQHSAGWNLKWFICWCQQGKLWESRYTWASAGIIEQCFNINQIKY